jgi:hypothetical protein
MNLTPGLVRITADGALIGAGIPVRVFQVQLKSGTQNALVNLRNGDTVAADVHYQIDGLNSKAVDVPYNGGAYFDKGCFAEVGTATSFVTFIITREP